MESQSRKRKRSEQTLSVVDEGMERRLVADLRSWHDKGRFNDCTLVCDNSPRTRVKMSSSLLSMRSPMLEGLLLSNLKEAKKKVIPVKGLDEKCFHKFVRYFLGRPLNLQDEDLDQAIQLYQTAHYYRMDELQTICLDVLVEKVHVDTVCQVVPLAAVYEEPKLKSAIKKCFATDMKRIRHYDSCKELWKSHTDFMSDLLMDVVSGEDKVLIIGGSYYRYEDDEWERRNSVLAFDPSNGSVVPWKSLRMARAGCVAGKYGDKIIVCGGRIGDSDTATDHVEIIERHSEFTVEGPPMIVKRRNAVSATLGEHFYVFGGLGEDGATLRSCERYSFQENRWELLKQPMHDALSACSAAAHGHFIYIIGGEDRNSFVCNTVNRYNTLKGRWTTMRTTMCQHRSWAACTVRQSANKILVSGNFGQKTCEQYDVENNTWQVLADMKRRRYGHSLVDFNGVVYAIGGDGEDSIEKLDENSGQWRIVDTATLPHEMGYFATVIF